MITSARQVGELNLRRNHRTDEISFLKGGRSHV